MSNEDEVAEPTVLTKAQAYKNVYTHLKNQDIAPWVEKKKISSSFQPDFLSWTHVWEFLLQTYPEFQLDYLDPINHDDGSMTVQCRLTIPFGDHWLSRTERLYVMDNKMNAIKNPSGQAINKADKRCFVKCAALFGLGIQLFTGEDLPDTGAVEKKEQPKKENPAPPPAPAPEKVMEGFEGDPDTYLDCVLGWATQSLKTTKTSDSVREIWRANKAGIDKLEREYPQQFEKLKTGFTALADKAKEEEAKDGK